MKSAAYRKRYYREWVRAGDLYQSRIIVRETDLQVLTNRPLSSSLVEQTVSQCRRDIESYIAKDNRFLTALKPLAVELSAPAIVRQMSKAAGAANVGPMAAVAGAIAEKVGRTLLRQGVTDVIVENGGDIFLASRKKREVGIFPGSRSPWKHLSLLVRPEDTPLGICTSSGTVGHSLSFGSTDSVVIMAKNAAVADALATAVANRVQQKSDLEKAASFAKSIPQTLGVVIILGKNLLSWGRIEFVS